MSRKIEPLEIDDVQFPVAYAARVGAYRAEVLYDTYDDDNANPRDCDGNLGEIVGWHRDYFIGDVQLNGGAVRVPFETARGRTEFRSMRTVARYLGIARGAVCILPLYLYDHSGISISAGAPNPFDNPVTRVDEFGTGLGWDTSMVGFVYTTADRVREQCGAYPYAPSDWTGTPSAWLARALNAEVRTYDAYLRGEVYWWRVVDADGDILESCGGYLPDVDERDSLAYIRGEAIDAAASLESDRRIAAATEKRERRRAAAAGIATIQEGGAR